MSYPNFTFEANGSEQILVTNSGWKLPATAPGEVTSFTAYLREGGLGRIQINTPSSNPQGYDGLHYDELPSPHFNWQWREKVATLFAAGHLGRTLHLENWKPGNGAQQDLVGFNIYWLDENGKKHYLW